MFVFGITQQGDIEQTKNEPNRGLCLSLFRTLLLGYLKTYEQGDVRDNAYHLVTNSMQLSFSCC